MPTLEPLRADHADAVLAFEQDNRKYFADSVSDRGDAYFEQFSARHRDALVEQEARKGAYFVLVDTDEVLGRFNLYGLAGGIATVGYRVAQHVAGHGVATVALRELCTVASTLGLHTLTAATSYDNIASQRVLIKAGFVPAGVADPSELGGKHGNRYRRELDVDRPSPPPGDERRLGPARATPGAPTRRPTRTISLRKLTDVASTWDQSSAGVLQLPSGRLVRGRGLRRPQPDGAVPELGVYLLGKPPAPMPWETRWLQWPDFRLPTDRDDARKMLREAWSRAGRERVEVACDGGRGRTGTALACLAVLDGVPAYEAVDYVRRRYDANAVETPGQRRYVARFDRF